MSNKMTLIIRIVVAVVVLVAAVWVGTTHSIRPAQ